MQVHQQSPKIKQHKNSELEAREFRFLKYKKFLLFFLRACLESYLLKLFNLGAQKFHFLKYKKSFFFWQNMRKFFPNIRKTFFWDNIRNFLEQVFLGKNIRNFLKEKFWRWGQTESIRNFLILEAVKFYFRKYQKNLFGRKFKRPKTFISPNIRTIFSRKSRKHLRKSFATWDQKMHQVAP